MSRAVCARLADGRLHLQHGPIDVLVQCWGEAAEVEAACRQAAARFESILPELVAELPRLRQPVASQYPLLRGPVARRMAAAVWPLRAWYITPMAAVAGAVADELMQALLHRRRLRKACVNDGGDIALHLAPGEAIEVGIVSDISRPALDATSKVHAAMPVRGIATSGWRGRSQSLGIADAVTVLARTAAEADAAATLIANAVNIEHPNIARCPARDLKEDSDLGDLLVTADVGVLCTEDVKRALENGAATAAMLHAGGAIHAAYLALQGQALACPGGVHLKLSAATHGRN